MKEVNKIIKNKKKLNYISKEKGITLLAMVITIIVLLILAGIVIRTITSDDGVINKASNARNAYEKAGKDENTALSNYANSIKQELDKIKKPISKSKSFVGHYVSLNGTSIDGIIFADLAVGGSGEWYNSDGKYNIPTVPTNELCDYYVCKEKYKANERFGEKSVITPMGKGKKRFYVMALTDVDGTYQNTEYEWYGAAAGKMKDIVTSTSFGSGEQNTAEMLKRWNSGYYGEKDVGHENGRDDIWGKIGDKVKEGWFVPSKEEFAAYAGELFSYEIEHSITCCGEKSQLSSHIWTSSQKDNSNVWVARFGGNCIGTGGASYGYYLRLAIRV